MMATSSLPESDVFSDDSGVDVKSRTVAVASENRRNKRKSTEPKKRKDVLLMKRFRWEDTDEEDVFERPSSGDSGCPLEEEEDEEEEPEKKKRPWKKQPKEEEVFRQSVICKSECPASSSPKEESNRRTRNYKSMSRQRRIEANARERTRVHTISAAFESLRRAVPAYAHNQKLSKLAILKIASAYIVALACLNGQTPVAECVEHCTRTIQAEGRSRRRSCKD